ncbi:MAG: hypothetical protein LBL50_05500 [Candidatus Margulisbacteria bacterium]|jgi:hypothetical protein|nr:hypothetical protein [Candidatus Margulisiibacteriota bacterium]
MLVLAAVVQPVKRVVAEFVRIILVAKTVQIVILMKVALIVDIDAAVVTVGVEVVCAAETATGPAEVIAN